MPNTFGSTGGGFPLFDPRLIRSDRKRFFRLGIPELEYANSLYVSNGLFPARGWLLMRRQDVDSLNTYSASLVLNIEDFRQSSPSALTFQNLALVQSRCVSRGLAADPDAIYLVEVTDKKGVLFNQWFRFPTNTQYNIRAPAYPGGYYTLSTPGGGSPWTWSSLVGDLWGQMSLLGAYPGLPIVPAGTPEGYSIPGNSAWEALCAILDLLGCAVATDLTQTAPYTIVYGGAADTAYAALDAKYLPIKEDDLEYVDMGSGRVPGNVVVYFHIRYRYFGTQETVRRDSYQWQTNPLYSVKVAAPAEFQNAVGLHFLWDDFTVQLDEDGVPLGADVATAAAIAQERVNQYYARIYRQTLGYMRRTYAGALPFATGSQVDGVCWRMQYTERDAGWETDITRGPMPAWPKVWFNKHVYR